MSSGTRLASMRVIGPPGTSGASFGHVGTLPALHYLHTLRQSRICSMSWLPGWQAGVDCDVLLSGEDERKVVEIKGEKDRRDTCPVYYDGESVKGSVSGSTALLVCGLRWC